MRPPDDRGWEVDAIVSRVGETHVLVRWVGFKKPTVEPVVNMTHLSVFASFVRKEVGVHSLFSLSLSLFRAHTLTHTRADNWDSVVWLDLSLQRSNVPNSILMRTPTTTTMMSVLPGDIPPHVDEDQDQDQDQVQVPTTTRDPRSTWATGLAVSAATGRVYVGFETHLEEVRVRY
jgi:hypothetical protein